ncbi:SurA N-terminal domain-containing protein [Halanaerobium hydrogeniformans]|uniref:Tetratricopeptide TPR_1 repeat-containing protein n=1 Tax=Halanaerobium hydrogeniformans TaxID=656519 RepID=E4RIJ2_HALHG|nr:SurA N-terminal domain-containing protein [Halanaerobium hydrogeniformans]ADQ15062.1 Tetratricopeptide TPR_1 repeat-containing protein [Halanaerobium hydrogeniformans]
MFSTLRNNSRIVVYIVVVAFVVTGAFMGYGAYFDGGGGGGGTQPPTSENPGVIAEVNNHEISEEEFFSVLQQQAPQRALSSSEIISFRYEILDSIIERHLILEKADDINVEVEVAEAEVEENYNALLEENEITEEELVENLSEQGFTLGDLKDDIRRNLERSKRLTQTIDEAIGEIEVSEAEIEELYLERYPEEETALADVEAELEDEIREGKRNEAVIDWLEGLKSEAEIVINEPVLSAYHEYQTENYEEAVEQFSSFIELESNPVFYNYLALSHSALGNYEAAEEIFSEAITEFPNDNDIGFNYAQLLVEQNKEAEAIEILNDISDRAGNDFMTRYQLFIMFSQLGAEEEANNELETIQGLSEEMEEEEDMPALEEDILEEEMEDIEIEDTEEDISVEDPIN